MAAFFLCGFGYNGNLPELGKITRPAEQNNEVQVKQLSSEKDKETSEFPQNKKFFPRIYSNYNIDRYSDYLKDIKEIEINGAATKLKSSTATLNSGKYHISYFLR